VERQQPVSLGRKVRRKLRYLALAGCLVLAMLAAGASLEAVAAAPGSKNFTAPSDVPNYFSNEGGSFRGDSTARAAQPAAVPNLAAATPRHSTAAASRRAGRHHAGRASKGRGGIRLARGRASSHRQVAHVRAGHVGTVRSAKAAGPKLTHANGSARSKAVAAKGHPAPGRGKTAARGRG
jgi:hypothetical protein